MALIGTTRWMSNSLWVCVNRQGEGCSRPGGHADLLHLLPLRVARDIGRNRAIKWTSKHQKL